MRACVCVCVYHLRDAPVRHDVSGVDQPVQHLRRLFDEITLVRVVVQLVICESNDTSVNKICARCIIRKSTKSKHPSKLVDIALLRLSSSVNLTNRNTTTIACASCKMNLNIYLLFLALRTQ